MQTLKPEVKENLRKAALEEFFNESYENSSIRRIAASAGTTAGNLYRYFPGKLELFSSLIEPAWLALSSFSDKHYQDHDDLELSSLPSLFENQIEDLAGIIADYRKEIYILFKKSSGTPYREKSIKYMSNMADHAMEHFSRIDLPGLKKSQYHILVEAFTKAYLEGWLDIISRPLSRHEIKNLTGNYLRISILGPLAIIKESMQP